MSSIYYKGLEDERDSVRVFALELIYFAQVFKPGATIDGVSLEMEAQELLDESKRLGDRLLERIYSINPPKFLPRNKRFGETQKPTIIKLDKVDLHDAQPSIKSSVSATPLRTGE